MGRSFCSTCSKSDSVSRRKAARRGASKPGKSFSSGETMSRVRSCIHCPAKLSTKARDFGSTSIRFTCPAKLRRKRPWLAKRNNSSSGMVLHRK